MICRNASRFAVVSIAALALAAAARPAQAINVLTDPGFELNPLTTASNSLNFFATYQGQWGQESATIVGGPDNGVFPNGGAKMLKEFNTGSYSQTFQVVNVTAFAAAIDAGVAIVSGGAKFDANLAAADASCGITFIDSSATYGNFTGPDILTGNFTLDSTPQSWQNVGASGTIPTGTRWIVFQVAYRDATLVDSTGALSQGYVDDAILDIRVVPEPTTLAALGGVAIAAIRRRRA